ncbi:MAG: outer membrane beta-barrel protein [Bacteroidales bacterium]|nr:outer membrane beta-barrel protein [Bacteroidales bacterium]
MTSIFSQNISSVQSQKLITANFQINLYVKDSANNQPLEFVTASLFRYENNEVNNKKEVYNYAISDINGKIVFSKLNPWYKYDIVLEYMGFQSENIKNINFIDNSSSLDKIDTIKNLGIIYMKENSFVLEETIIKASAIPIKMIGDTIQYNASAFDIKESDMLEDFLRKLPGWAIDKNGRITVNGSVLEQITLNGRTFFTSDPAYVAKILPARLVQNVKVFDKRSEESVFLGVDDGNSVKTADVKTKDEINGWVGNSNAIAGLKRRYKTDHMIAKFNKQNQYAFIGAAANIPKSVSTSTGNTNSYNVGANTNIAFKKNKKSIKSDFSYIFNREDKGLNTETYQENYLADNILIDDQINSENSKNGIHKFMAGYTMNSGADFLIVTKVNYLKKTNDLNKTRDYTSKNSQGETINYGHSEEYGRTDVNNGGVDLSLTKKFKKSGSGINIKISLDYSTSRKISTYNYDVSSMDTVINVNQRSILDNKDFGFTSNATYSHPIFKSLVFSFKYNISTKRNEVLKNTFSKNLNGEYNQFDKDYSSNFINKISDQSLSLHIMPKIRDKKKFDFTAGLIICPLTIKHINDSTNYSKKVINIAPELNLSYNKAGVGKFLLQYKGNSIPPSINYLLPIKDNSNPINIINGNPKLIPEFNNTILLGVGRSSDPKIVLDHKKKSLDSYGNRTFSILGSYTFNKIILKSYYDEAGVKYSVPVNEDGFYTFGFRYEDISFFNDDNIFLTGNLDMLLNRGFSYINSIKIASKSISSAANIKLTTKLEYIDFSFGINAENINNQYSIKGKLRETGWLFNFTGDMILKLPGSFTLRSDINCRKYKGFISGDNDIYTIWNAFLSKPIFRKKIDVTVSAYDILNQNVNLIKTYSDNYLLISKSYNIRQLFLIGFTYRFYLGNNTGIAKERASRVIDQNYKSL